MTLQSVVDQTLQTGLLTPSREEMINHLLVSVSLTAPDLEALDHLMDAIASGLIGVGESMSSI
ncbi:MAG: hypothetical protein HC921_13295 [Synechococcaceae cyanobacterium SM2_3_1]|nr:hypothetical protein [Synechococcaceae cyanobacterium SM2_3_1]